MQYTKPKFSVPMPGDKVAWPFDSDRNFGEDFWFERCSACGASVACDTPGFMKAHEHPDDAGRPRRRVCFGR